MSYSDEIIEKVKAKNPNEPEFTVKPMHKVPLS